MVPLQPRKIWPYVVVIIFGIFLVQSPEAAAQLVNWTFGLLTQVAAAVSTFIEAL